MNDETRVAPAKTSPPDALDAAAATAPTLDQPGNDSETLPQNPDRIAVLTASGRAVVPGYELLEELGRGGMGVVYKARQIKLNRIVALKMVLAGGHANPVGIARFVTEAEAVAAVRHTNVIQVFDSGETDGHPYLAMEYLAGGSLAQSLRASGKLTPREAANLVLKVARGVHAAHERGIVHRDLKPHNILLDAPFDSPVGSLGEPKVMDFGLAKRDGTVLTLTGALLGTPAYMAPEQARGESKNIGRAADVYALGVILYECLCGSVPFSGQDPWSVIQQAVNADPEPVTNRAAGIPRDLDLVCRKCLEKAPGDRYQSAAALADDLQRFLNGETLVGPRTGFWYVAQKSVRRRWRPVLAAIALIALILTAWFLPTPHEIFFGKMK
jgi:eukaryotic-like serine/threonine-protein kinase